MPEPCVDAMLTTPTTGLDVRYRDWAGPAGQDGSPVLLLHGLASTCRIYDTCTPLLTQGRRVVAYDQRGHGDSAKPTNGYDFATLVADGVGIAQALGLRMPYVVVGHSWGAMVALEWAVRRPDDVLAAVLVDGAAFSFRDLPGATWESTAQRFAPPDLRGLDFEGLIERTRHGDLSFLDEDTRRTFFSSLMRVLPDGSIQARLSRESHLRILRAMWDENLDDVYQALRRPALAVLATPRDAKSPIARVKRASVARLQERHPCCTSGGWTTPSTIFRCNGRRC